jgi:hypothetical protein
VQSGEAAERYANVLCRVWGWRARESACRVLGDESLGGHVGLMRARLFFFFNYCNFFFFFLLIIFFY